MKFGEKVLTQITEKKQAEVEAGVRLMASQDKPSEEPADERKVAFPFEKLFTELVNDQLLSYDGHDIDPADYQDF